MNRITSVIMMHARDRLTWFFLPWGIVLSSFLINVIIGVVLGGNTPIYTGGLSSIYIYMLVVGAATLKETFPFALGFSVRRRDYYLGTLLMIIGVSAISALLIWLLALIEGSLVPNWGINLHFFHLPYLNDGSLVEQLCIYFVLMVCMVLLGFVFASTFQRFRRTGLYSLFTTLGMFLSLFSILATYWNWWGNIFGWFAQETAFDLALWMLPVIAVCGLASYTLLRKATA